MLHNATSEIKAGFHRHPGQFFISFARRNTNTAYVFTEILVERLDLQN